MVSLLHGLCQRSIRLADPVQVIVIKKKSLKFHSDESSRCAGVAGFLQVGDEKLAPFVIATVAPEIQIGARCVSVSSAPLFLRFMDVSAPCEREFTGFCNKAV